VSDTASLFSHRTFEEFELAEPLRLGLADLGFTNCTLVQAEVLPLTLARRDVAAQAQTGTGKTAAYLLTIFQRLLSSPRAEPGPPRALIVAPTRELVIQVAADAELLGARTGLRVEAIYGGADFHGQRDRLTAGIDVLSGTPGRLLDFLRQGVTSLSLVEVVVIDEADRMFDMGFIDDLRSILRRLPRPGQRQTLFFSATLTPRVWELGWSEMRDPAEVIVNPEEITPDRLEQSIYHVGSREKFSLLLGLLRRTGFARTMVFLNTREGARRLAERLVEHGISARALTGAVTQQRRLRALDDFKSGKLAVLVATDVASRGLHIEGVTHVVNYDLPLDPEDYVHRVGRTARVGREGSAISLACEDYVFSLPAIERLIGATIPQIWADDELFAAVQPAPRRGREHSTARRGQSGRGRPRRPAPARR